VKALLTSTHSIHLFKEQFWVKPEHQPSQRNGSVSFLSAIQRFHVEENGGAKRDRTADLLRARQALSQLSYSPIFTPIIVSQTFVLINSNW
jgi:hypothetical protein